MRGDRVHVSSWICALAIAVALAPANAQSLVSGAVVGRVTDARDEPMFGITVVATSPELPGGAAEITDDQGRYRLADLPPGTYDVMFYAGSEPLRRRRVAVLLNATVQLDEQLGDVGESVGNVEVIELRMPTIDTTRAARAVQLDRTYLTSVPIGVSFGEAVDHTAVSIDDAEGVGFAGATSLETRWAVDGTSFGLPLDNSLFLPLGVGLVDAVQLVTGGWDADLGDALGGQVNAVTRRGTNSLTAALAMSGGFYPREPTALPRSGTVIEERLERQFIGDSTLELSGPLAVDRAWFFAAYNPVWQRTRRLRFVSRLTDCRARGAAASSACDAQFADGRPDIDPGSGAPIVDELDRRASYRDVVQHQLFGRIDVAPTASQQGSLGIFVVPALARGDFGTLGGDAVTGRRSTALSGLGHGGWRARLGEATSLEIGAGATLVDLHTDPRDKVLRGVPATRVLDGTLGRFAAAGREAPAVVSGCRDGDESDVYPQIDNCPADEYWLDSPGMRLDARQGRLGGRVGLTHFADASGQHELGIGLGGEMARYQRDSQLTGGRMYLIDVDDELAGVLHRADGVGSDDGRAGLDTCGFTEDERPIPCRFVERAPLKTRSRRLWGYAQERWSIGDHVTLRAGARYDWQELGHAGPTDRERGDRISIRGLSPRGAIIVDPTGEARGKLFVTGARYLESLPLVLADRSFDRERRHLAIYAFDQCASEGAVSPDSDGIVPSPASCPQQVSADAPPLANVITGERPTIVPGLRAPQVDELVLGGEWALPAGISLGVALRHRRLAHAIETVAVPGGTRVFVANPGELSAREEGALAARALELAEDDPERARLVELVRELRLLKTLPAATREHAALEIDASWQPGPATLLRGGLVLQRTRGNYAGLVDDDVLPTDPHGSPQWDAPALLVNREGRLPQDRPLALALVGYHSIGLPSDHAVVLGAAYRGRSGRPTSIRAGDVVEADTPTFVLPRGTGPRLDFEHAIDVRFTWRQRGRLAFVELVNLQSLAGEPVRRRDETYSRDAVGPVLGGAADDLLYIRRVDGNGRETAAPAGRHPGYHEPSERGAPFAVRVGMRIEL